MTDIILCEWCEDEDDLAVPAVVRIEDPCSDEEWNLCAACWKHFMADAEPDTCIRLYPINEKE